MNAIDMLLAADAGKISAQQTEEVEIPRLSRAMGQPFYVTVKSVAPERMDEINDTAIKMTSRGRYKGIDIGKLKLLTLCDGIVSPDLRNKELLEKFGAETPKELIAKLFRAGEITKIYEKIQNISGFEEETDEIKN